MIELADVTAAVFALSDPLQCSESVSVYTYPVSGRRPFQQRADQHGCPRHQCRAAGKNEARLAKSSSNAARKTVQQRSEVGIFNFSLSPINPHRQ